MPTPADAGATQAPDMSHIDPGLQPTLITLLYLCPSLSLFVLLVRFWRKSGDYLLGGDDVVISVAWILSIVDSIITYSVCKATYAGYRQHDVPFYAIDRIYTLKLQYALSIIYNPCIGLVRASFLWSLYRLRSRNPRIKCTIIGLQVINGIYVVATTIVSAVPCLPVSKVWNPRIPGGCYSQELYMICNVSVALITDFLVLLIPTWIIWDLQMPLKRKLITIAFLSLGLVVIAIGVARLLWLLDAFRGNDNSYSVTSAYSAVESSVAIIGTSGPTVKYMLSFCKPCHRASCKRSATKRNPKAAYANRNHPDIGISRRTRKGNASPYDDLDCESIENQNIEMQSDWQQNSDAHSDEQRITSLGATQSGIMKSVEWTVHTTEGSLGDNTISLVATPVGGTEDRMSGGRLPEQPTDIV